MKHRTAPFGDWSLKLIAGVVVLACLALGAIGLLLPIVPGLLFLAIAACVAASHFPAFGTRLRRNRTLGRFLDRADLIWRARRF